MKYRTARKEDLRKTIGALSDQALDAVVGGTIGTTREPTKHPAKVVTPD
jgi:hypothetical protein